MPDTSVEVKKAAPTAREAVPDMWRAFRSEFDRLFDRFDSSFGFPAVRRLLDLEPFRRGESSFGANVPAVDVTEDEKAYTIAVELPGLDEKDVEVSVRDDRLTLKGEKRQEKEEKKQNYYLSERSYGAFERVFRLPDSVDQDKIAARFSKGVLTVTLPKTVQAQKRKKITVTPA
jgi:HSP20 family protein